MTQLTLFWDWTAITGLLMLSITSTFPTSHEMTGPLYVTKNAGTSQFDSVQKQQSSDAIKSTMQTWRTTFSILHSKTVANKDKSNFVKTKTTAQMFLFTRWQHRTAIISFGFEFDPTPNCLFHWRSGTPIQCIIGPHKCTCRMTSKSVI